MDVATVRRAYQYWAPVYDTIFGPFSDASRRHALEIINRRQGRLLEVGVGTGLSLKRYGPQLSVTGIDISTDMLDKANARIRRKGLKNIEGLHVMDARRMAFADNSFDIVVAMFVMRSVPEPEQVMREIERVCRPGGEVFIVNSMGEDDGLIRRTERQITPLAVKLGWNPVFEMDSVLKCPNLELQSSRVLRPLNLFTMLHFVKQPNGAGAAPASAAVNGAHRPAPDPDLSQP